MARRFRSSIWALGALALLAHPVRAEDAPIPPERPISHGSDLQCRARLVSQGVIIDESATIPPPAQAGCAVVEPLNVRGFTGLPGNPLIVLAGRPTLSCAMVERLAHFVLDVADPAARQVLGAGLTSIDAGPGHVCRTRNNQPDAKLSSHAQGLAVDLVSVTLQDRRALTLSAPSLPQERDWIAHVTARACVHFNTVLGIGSDAFHATNIHIDLEPRGRDGTTKFCR